MVNDMGKLSDDDKIMILQLWDTCTWTQQKLADKFEVHKTRINHLVNNTYGERDRLEGSRGPET